MKKLFFLIALLFVLTSVPSFAHAAPALDSIPDAVKSKYEFNGSITSVVSDGATLYVGGGFTEVTLRSGEPFSSARNYLAAIDLTTYTLTSFDPNLNSSVTSLALSSDGSTLYVGGSFTCVGGVFEDACLEVEHLNIAAIDTTTGNADAIFFDPDGEVNTLALSGDDSLLFAGGSFTSVNSTGDPLDRNNIAAFTTVDGIATDFDPDVDGTVRSIKLSADESAVYVAGGFITVNGGLPQTYLAGFDSDTGEVTGFNGSLDSEGQVLALSSDGQTLYVGGSFAEFLKSAGEGVPFDEVTQEPVAVYPKISTIDFGPGATVYASIPDGNGGWYIGGSFTTVGTTTQASLAHITPEGVLDSAFTPSFVGDPGDATVYALELSPDQTTLYAGGNFFSGSEQYAAAFDTSDGSITSFSPYPGGTVYDLELSSDGETLYLGGDFGTMTGDFTPKFNVAAMDTTGVGTLLAFDPQTGGASGVVHALRLTADDTTLYFGGEFTNVNIETTADTRNKIAAFSTAGAGTLVAGFDPDADGDVYALALSSSETVIYAGGGFSTIGGGSRTALAKLDTADGSLIAPFDADVTGNSQDVRSFELSSDEATLYVAGGFTQLGTDERANFGEVDITTGAATNFSPNFNDVARSVSVSTSTGEVYIGGSFTGYGAEAVANLIAIDLSDSSLITAFTPVPDATVLTLALSSDDELLYAGGDFADVNSGTSRDYLAAFDTTDGTATTFDPVGTSYVYGLGLAADDTELYVGNYDINTGTSTLLIFDAGAGGSETLTVSKDGTGSGTVTSAPSGINCGGDCTEDYAADTEVTLTASATAGSEFIGWSGGGCSGTGVCVVTMSAAQSVTATFDLEEDPGDDEEETPPADEDDGGGSSGTHRKPISNPPSFHGDSNLLYQLQLKLIELLKQLLQELIKTQAATL